jgi:hypothetical protein
MLNVRMAIEEVDLPAPFEEVGMEDLQRIMAVIDLQVLFMEGVQ